MRDAKAAPALMKALGQENHKVRRHGARNVGKIGPAAKEAVPALKKALNDESNSVRYNARRAPVRIGGE